MSITPININSATYFNIYGLHYWLERMNFSATYL